MKLDSVDQSNIDGCIHLKGTEMIVVFYLKFICLMLVNDDLVFIKICRFMGNFKRAVKNKARVKGSICVSYIHRGTTYFCSHYFKNFMLSPHNIRNQTSIEVERRPPMLLVFDQQGCPSGKEFIHWLTNDEKDSPCSCVD